MEKQIKKTLQFLEDEPEREYTLSEFWRYKFFPWARHHRTIKKMVMRDAFGGSLLQARREGKGRQTRYYIKGKNIIIYIKTYGPALAGTGRKNK